MNNGLTKTVNSKLMERVGGKILYDKEGKPVFVNAKELARVQTVMISVCTSPSEITINGKKHQIPRVVWDGTQNKTVQTAFNMCLSCNCCGRHGDGKPESLSNMSFTKRLQTDVGEPDVLGHDCSCSCRHRARVMARQFAD